MLHIPQFNIFNSYHCIKLFFWQEFPPKSTLDIAVYGDQTSILKKEQLEINLGGLTVEKVMI